MTCAYKKAVEENKIFVTELVEELTNIVKSYWYLLSEKYEATITDYYLNVLGFLQDFKFKVKSLDIIIQNFINHKPLCSNRSCLSLILKEEDKNDLKNINKQKIELKNVIKVI